MQMRHKLLIALFCVLVLAGCGGGASKFVGDWTTTLEGMPATMSLTGDGKATFTVEPPQMQGAKMQAMANWRESGDKLYMTFTDAKVSGLPAALKGQEGAVEEGMKKGLGLNVEKASSFKWNDDNSFTTTEPDGKSNTFTRKK